MGEGEEGEEEKEEKAEDQSSRQLVLPSRVDWVCSLPPTGLDCSHLP